MNPSSPDGDKTVDGLSEAERLTKLRRDVAAGLLELSQSAKRDADALLASDADASSRDAPTKGWLYGSFAAGLATGLLIAALLWSFGDDAPPTGDPVAMQPSAQEPAPPPSLAAPAEPTAPAASPSPTASPDPIPPSAQTAPEPSEGLVLSITAAGPCWIRAETDRDGEPLERLLSAGEILVVEAREEAALRIGDPAAISMSINGRRTRSLGAAGRIVDLHITLDNFQTLLAN